MSTLPTNPTIAPAMTPERWRTSLTNGRAAAFRHPHLIAALALHDQPFGFTAADYKAVRYMATWASNRELVTDEMQDALHRVADKIAALLPPEDA